jgi:P27 family predicted phage terminase small subunit
MTSDAKAEWRRVMPVLVERRVLSGADLAACERYCEATGDIAIARAAIATQGAYVENRLGELKRHPAFATLRESTAEARRWAACPSSDALAQMGVAISGEFCSSLG